MQQNNNFRVLAKERCLSTFSAHYQCNDIIMVDDGDKLEACLYCNDKPATVIPVTPARVILVKEEPTTPVKASKQEKQCPDAPKKAASRPRENIRPIPISPALRFDAPVNWCDQCCAVRNGQVFCSKCGNGLIARPQIEKYECRVCHGTFERTGEDSYCACCGSNMHTPLQNYQVAFVKLGKPVESDTVIKAMSTDLTIVFKCVVLKGTDIAGIHVSGEYSPQLMWSHMAWYTQPVGGISPLPANVKLIRKEGDRLVIILQ